MTYLVYILFDPSGLPFYVGVTTNLQRRAYRWKNSFGAQYHAYVLIAENLSEQTALALEAHYINLIRCFPEGPLLNKAKKGGHSGFTQSIEARERIRAAQIGRTRSPETRAKMSIARQNMSEETRQRISIAARNRKPKKELI